MEDPNIAIEEYIQLETERAFKKGKYYDWETATHGKIRYFEEDESFEYFKTEFPAIGYGDAPTFEAKAVPKYTVLDFDVLAEEMEAAMTDILRMEHIVRELILDFFSTYGFDDAMVDLETVGTLQFQLGELKRRMSWRQFILGLGLHTEEEIDTDGFKAYWDESLRDIASKGDLRDYWTKISSSGDFLTSVPSYTQIREPLRRLCHRLIALSIAGRGQAPEKVTSTNMFLLRSIDVGTPMNVPYLLAYYLFRYASRRKQGAKMFGCHFIACLGVHFGVITEESLWTSTMEVRGLTSIDAEELIRLRNYERFGDVLTWVALGPERQQAGAAVGATQVDLEVAQEGVQAGLAPAAPVQTPLADPAPRTIHQRLQRLKEEVHGFGMSLAGQRVVVDRMSTDFARFSTWVVGHLGQLLEVGGVIYPGYGDLRMAY
ncbi:hypothetical protein Tco_0695572 [Tanacetum coccineum]